MDKLFFHGELFALRCSFMNLPMLCPIFIGSLFYEGFYTKDGLDFPLAHGYRFARPTSLGPPVPIFGFYSLQLPPSPHLVHRYLRKGIKWGDGQIDSCWRIYVHGLMDEIPTRTVINFSLDDDVNTEWMVSSINKVTVRGIWDRQGYRVLTSWPEAFMAHDMCRSLIGLYLGSKRCFVFRALHL